MTRMDLIRADYRRRLMDQLVDCCVKLATTPTKAEETALYRKWKAITDSLTRDLGLSLEDIDNELKQRLSDE